MPRPHLHGGAGDGVSGVVKHGPAHGRPLPLGERGVDDLDDDHEVPQHGRLGGRGGGCGGCGGHGGGERGRAQGRGVHAPSRPRAR